MLVTLNPENSSFLLVEDRVQQIYHRKPLSQELGVSFKGRSKILTINYRNTEQIINFAWHFYKYFCSNSTPKQDEEIIEVIPPQSTRRRGPVPIIRKFASFKEEAFKIAEEIKKLHENDGIDYSDIAVLYRIKKLGIDYVTLLTKAMDNEKIPYYWLSENTGSKRQFQKNDSTIKLSTIESSKGLEFKVVFICSINNCPLFLEKEIEREVSLMYIGMTRASEKLYLTYSGESLFTKYLEEKMITGEMQTNDD